MGKILRKRQKRLDIRRRSRQVTVDFLNKAAWYKGDAAKAFRMPGALK